MRFIFLLTEGEKIIVLYTFIDSQVYGDNILKKVLKASLPSSSSHTVEFITYFEITLKLHWLYIFTKHRNL